jgi:hypothetical protein
MCSRSQYRTKIPERKDWVSKGNSTLMEPTGLPSNILKRVGFMLKAKLSNPHFCLDLTLPFLLSLMSLMTQTTNSSNNRMVRFSLGMLGLTAGLVHPRSKSGWRSASLKIYLSLLTWICRVILFEEMIISRRLALQLPRMDIGRTFDKRSTCVSPRIIMLMSLGTISMHIHMITLEMHRQTTEINEGTSLLSQDKWGLRCPRKCGLRDRTNSPCRNSLSGILFVYP